MLSNLRVLIVVVASLVALVGVAVVVTTGRLPGPELGELVLLGICYRVATWLDQEARP